MSDIRNLLESLDNMVKEDDDVILVGDSFDIELHENFVIETGVVGFMEDGIIVQGDDAMFEFLDLNGVLVESIEEGKGMATLALIASLAGLWGVNNHLAQQAYDHSPQLQQLMKFHAMAQERGDQRMIDQLEDRIEAHKLRLDLGKGEVMGKDGRPIPVIYDKEKRSQVINTDFEESISEAEYQGRKVTLNKPMKGDVKKSKVYVKGPKGNVVKVNFGDKNMKIKKSNPKRRKSFRARHNCDNPGPKWKARYWSCRAW